MTISKELADKLIQDSMNSLHSSGLIERAIETQENTVLLGKGSILDSLAFVTFISELEDRLSRVTGKELYLVLEDTNESNIDNPYSSVGSLSRYLMKIAE